ncbi:MAG: NAD(P)H-dependent oxidoreductase subunit E [Candidatus Lokiarchaeota archaeon]|nr:NAD(P)H-dependent oxidoreductase subunit E [Candidatus Harpocratesius repetitus]
MAKISLKICCGMNCLAHGGQELLDLVEDSPTYTAYVELACVECLNTCGDRGYNSPVVELNGKIYSNMTAEKLMELLDQLIQTNNN